MHTKRKADNLKFGRPSLGPSPEAEEIIPGSKKLLKEGKGFGELALLDPKNHRTCGVRIYEDCDFAIIHKADYQRYLSKRKFYFLVENHRMNINREIQEIKLKVNLFRNWHYLALKELFNSALEMEVGRGYEIFSPKRKANYFYLVLGGEFELSYKMSFREKNEEDDDAEFAGMIKDLDLSIRKVKIAQIKKWELIAENDIFLQRKNYSVSCTCISREGRFYRIPKNKYLGLALGQKIEDEKEICLQKEIFIKERLNSIKKTLYKEKDLLGINLKKLIDLGEKFQCYYNHKDFDLTKEHPCEVKKSRENPFKKNSEKEKLRLPSQMLAPSPRAATIRKFEGGVKNSYSKIDLKKNIIGKDNYLGLSTVNTSQGFQDTKEMSKNSQSRGQPKVSSFLSSKRTTELRRMRNSSEIPELKLRKYSFKENGGSFRKNFKAEMIKSLSSQMMKRAELGSFKQMIKCKSGFFAGRHSSTFERKKTKDEIISEKNKKISMLRNLKKKMKETEYMFKSLRRKKKGPEFGKIFLDKKLSIKERKIAEKRNEEFEDLSKAQKINFMKKRFDERNGNLKTDEINGELDQLNMKFYLRRRNRGGN